MEIVRINGCVHIRRVNVFIKLTRNAILNALGLPGMRDKKPTKERLIALLRWEQSEDGKHEIARSWNNIYPFDIK